MPPTKAMREKREKLVIEHMESENRHEFDVTMDTFDHPRYELIATGDVFDGEGEVDGYFEETSLGRIHEGDLATVKLMGYSRLVRGHVGGVARGINIPNVQPDQAGLASVNPIFTWVRLAQRVPVRIHIDQVPDGVRLVAGMTATVQIDPQPAASKR